MAPPSERRRVALVDDHPLTRRGLAAIVHRTPGFELCAEGGTGGEAERLVAQRTLDLLLLAVTLPDANGIELTKVLRGRPGCPAILIVSMYDDALYAEWALGAGASGYICKDETVQKIGEAMEKVLRGEIYVSGRIQRQLLLHASTRSIMRPSFPIDLLSTREREVLALLGIGLGTRDVAAQLRISVKTVDSYREHLKTKLGLENSSELIRYAVQWHRSTPKPPSLPVTSLGELRRAS